MFLPDATGYGSKYHTLLVLFFKIYYFCICSIGSYISVSITLLDSVLAKGILFAAFQKKPS